MKEIYVVWRGPAGERQYTRFKKQESAYNFMLEKLGSGVWACISDKVVVHKTEPAIKQTRIIRS